MIEVIYDLIVFISSNEWKNEWRLKGTSAQYAIQCHNAFYVKWSCAIVEEKEQRLQIKRDVLDARYP